jgi:hypothetical protein
MTGSLDVDDGDGSDALPQPWVIDTALARQAVAIHTLKNLMFVLPFSLSLSVSR